MYIQDMFNKSIDRDIKGVIKVGINPRNPGEKIEIPAFIAPVFKAGKLLKDKVNE